jgi:hypothetical protein
VYAAKPVLTEEYFLELNTPVSKKWQEQISGSVGVEYEDDCLLEYCAV